MINETLNRVISKMIKLENDTNLKEGCPISIIDMKKWEWAQGVGLYGLVKYYGLTKDSTILQYITEWFDQNIELGLPMKNVNTMCPMLTLSYLYEYTKKEKYLQICEEWAAWIMKEMPRTEEKGLQHIVSGEENSGQLWDDTLFMTVLFLARMGKILNKKEYIDESIRQFLVHIKYLTDRKTGLLFHGWTFQERHNFAEARWARGNCWFTAGVPEYIEIVEELNDGVRWFLLDALESQIKELCKLQNSNGMWHTLLDAPDSYQETSATAGFAYGILKAVRKGYIGEQYKVSGLKAAQAVLQRINSEGTVTEVSYGTGMGRELDFYKQIPICPMTYGQALAILMLTECEDEAAKFDKTANLR